MEAGGGAQLKRTKSVALSVKWGLDPAHVVHVSIWPDVACGSKDAGC